MNFVKAFLTFVRMYKDGFYFSESIHIDKDGTHWGFYRFNETNEYSLFDIDFSFKKDHTGYFHIHGNDYRMVYKGSKLVEKTKLNSFIIPFSR